MFCRHFRRFITGIFYLCTCQPSCLGHESHIWVRNFNLMLTHAYVPISHALLKNKSYCNHNWQTSGKYVICKHVVCTQRNNRMKSTCINNSSSAKYSLIFKIEELVLGQGYPGTERQKCSEHLQKHFGCLCVFVKAFQHFQI